MPIDFLMVRDDDIPALVRENACDLGIVGKNVLEEKRLEFMQDAQETPFRLIQDMDFGHCQLSFAYPENGPIQSLADVNGQRIAQPTQTTEQCRQQKTKNQEKTRISDSQLQAVWHPTQ